ncbi:hypothetical protein D3C86_1765600 [compost metagenome]
MGIGGGLSGHLHPGLSGIDQVVKAHQHEGAAINQHHAYWCFLVSHDVPDLLAKLSVACGKRRKAVRVPVQALATSGPGGFPINSAGRRDERFQTVDKARGKKMNTNNYQRFTHDDVLPAPLN